jgi:hypothetical protein
MPLIKINAHPAVARRVVTGLRCIKTDSFRFGIRFKSTGTIG